MNIDEKTGGFSSLGEFLVKVRKACDGMGHRDSRLKTTGHMAENDDAQGGYLVPEQWADEIRHVALEDSIVRSRAIVLKAVRDSLKVRMLVESDRASNIFGGVTFTWTEEAGTKTGLVSKPALGLLELTPHKLVGGLYVSNEIEDDYGAFGNFMKIAFGRALRFYEDYYFLWGSGAGQPQGIMNSGGLVTETRTANNKVDWKDFANMAKRLLPGSWNRAVWLINPDVMDELFEATASAANQVTVWDASRNTIFNRPIIVTEKCAAMGSTGDVILADFSHYVIADRSIEIAGSRYGPSFDEDETFWRVVLRVDGQAIMSADIPPMHGANDLSAFVCLSTDS